MNPNLNLSCRLNDRDFAERKTVLKNEIFNSVQTIEELENGYLLKFDEEDGFDAKLMELMVTERKCCPFFEIKIRLLPYKKGIHLEVSGQAGVKDFLKKELID